MSHLLENIPTQLTATRVIAQSDSAWTLRYGDRHRLHRVAHWPPGIQPPVKVRVYYRQTHFILQWWEPSAHCNLSDRVDGDLVEVVARAREIDHRLLNTRRSGHTTRRLTHTELIEKFLADSVRRMEAGQITQATVDRYRTALTHYLAFCGGPSCLNRYASAADRALALAFSKFLLSRVVSGTGRNGKRLSTTGAEFVWDAVRAAFRWAADPDRGNLLPDAFRSPFAGPSAPRPRTPAADPFGQPDITTDMAANFLAACDPYQLRLFAPLVLFGLRAAEPAFLFHEYTETRGNELWLRVPCDPELYYTTKGKREKRLPLKGPLADLLFAPMTGVKSQGLMFVRRSVAESRELPLLLNASRQRLIEEISKRTSGNGSVQMTVMMRDKVLRDAGALNYDHIQHEYHAVAHRLGWSTAATLKDFRHLFATSLAAAGMPDPYRQYLMGHAQTSAAIGIYTHLNTVGEHYDAAMAKCYGRVLEVLATGTKTASSMIAPGERNVR